MGGKSSTQPSLDVFEKNTIDIAVAGMWGTGKSSLVNALRGLSDFEEGAAETGVIQTTLEPRPYPHSIFPDVTIWDLPGFGTSISEAEEYLRWVNYSQYDIFIIVSSTRVTVYDIQLSCAIRKMKKQFYYVQSKMDVSMTYEKWCPNFNEVATLQQVRKYCLDRLAKADISSSQIFLVSSFYPNKYDFPLLWCTLDSDIHELRKCISRPAILPDMRHHDRSAHQGLNVMKKNTFDVAITGVSGAGKSSLVNALRGLSDFAEGAAQADVIERTTPPKAYLYPTFPHVTLWDLPGIGTSSFKGEEYLEKVNYHQYDFFLIVASNRFTVYDIQLSRAVQAMGKKLFYVCSKMDISIQNEKMNPGFNEETTCQKIRNYCLSNLVEAGISFPEVFLVSSWYREKFDFRFLQRALENVMEEFRRHGSVA